MNKGNFDNSVGMIISQLPKGLIFKSASGIRQRKFSVKRKSMIYAFTNTAFYSPEKAAEKIRAEKITNSTCHKEDKKKKEENESKFKIL